MSEDFLSELDAFEDSTAVDLEEQMGELDPMEALQAERWARMQQELQIEAARVTAGHDPMDRVELFTLLEELDD